MREGLLGSSCPRKEMETWLIPGHEIWAAVLLQLFVNGCSQWTRIYEQIFTSGSWKRKSLVTAGKICSEILVHWRSHVSRLSLSFIWRLIQARLKEFKIPFAEANLACNKRHIKTKVTKRGVNKSIPIIVKESFKEACSRYRCRRSTSVPLWVNHFLTVTLSPLYTPSRLERLSLQWRKQIVS